jgi:hypothetical protein
LLKGFCAGGWALVFGLALGFANGIFLRYVHDNALIAFIGAAMSFALCCCVPAVGIYRWCKSIRTPEISVVTMDLIEREEANKDPNRGMGGTRNKHFNKDEAAVRDDANLDPYTRRRPDDVRKKWANTELDFDDLYGVGCTPLCYLWLDVCFKSLTALALWHGVLPA